MSAGAVVYEPLNSDAFVVPSSAVCCIAASVVVLISLPKIQMKTDAIRKKMRVGWMFHPTSIISEAL